MRYVTIQARNIANLDEVDGYIKYLLDQAANDNVRKWVKSQFRNWMINKYQNVRSVKNVENDSPEWLKKAIERGEEVFTIELFNRFEQMVDHTVDFLNTLNGNINYSVEDAFKATEAWDKQREKAAEKEGLQKIIDKEEDGIEEVHEYNNGFKWVSVFGKESLDREGKLMKHCVGSYANAVAKGSTTIYSLRDSKNVPHCTIEIRGNYVTQIKGYHNGPINEKYVPYVKDFLEKKYVKINSVDEDEILNLGYMIINKKWYYINDLPENLELSALDLNRNTIVKKLPKNLVIKNNLYINHTKITTLPEGLKVKDCLYCNGTPITEIQNNVVINGVLSLNPTSRQSLKFGKNIYIDELSLDNYDIDDLSGLKTNNLIIEYSSVNILGEVISVDSLSLNTLDIKSLPKKIKVKYDLEFLNNEAHNLSDTQFIVKGILTISGCHDLEKLPKFKCGQLDLVDCPKVILPKGLKIKEDMLITNKRSSLYRSKALIDAKYNACRVSIHDSFYSKFLPSNWTIGGSLKLEKLDSLLALPNNLKVMGDLTILDCPNLMEPGKNVTVGGYIYARNTDINMLKEVFGDEKVNP